MRRSIRTNYFDLVRGDIDERLSFSLSHYNLLNVGYFQNKRLSLSDFVDVRAFLFA